MTISRRTLIGSTVGTLLAASLAVSLPARADEHGYVVDSAGEPVMAGGGGCVHTGRWKDSMPTCPEPTLVMEEGKGMIVFAADDSEFFGFDKVKLSDQVKADLDSVVGAVKDADMLNSVVITGHADHIGSAPYNEKLALHRAEAVKDYLIAKGIPADRIEAMSDGSSAPLVTCPNIKNGDKLIRCLAPNRRVDIEAILADDVDITAVAIPQSAE